MSAEMLPTPAKSREPVFRRTCQQLKRPETLQELILLDYPELFKHIQAKAANCTAI